MKKHKTTGATKNIADNRRARFDYEILETFEAGIILEGPEVKSAKGGGLNLSGSFVTFHENLPQLLGARIAPYPYSQSEIDPERTRNILLKRDEIDYLRGKRETAGLTLVPLRAYLKRGLIKLEIGIARGRQAKDKRRLIQERETSREVERDLQSRAKKRT